jgi:ribosomal protein L37AE/L43A
MDIRNDGENKKQMFWKSWNGNGFHTVYYCPRCKKQITWHTIAFDLFKCDICGLKMKYQVKDDRLHLK